MSYNDDKMRVSEQYPKYKLDVGSCPVTEDNIKDYDIIINVSCSPCLSFGKGHQQRFWFPINEQGEWGYSSIFGFKKTMDYAVANNLHIYVHCHAGAGRAPAMTQLWLMSRGELTDESDIWCINHLIEYGHIPDYVWDLYKCADETGYSLGGCLHKMRNRALYSEKGQWQRHKHLIRFRIKEFFKKMKYKLFGFEPDSFKRQ